MHGQLLQFNLPGMAGPGRRKTTSTEFRDAVLARTRDARESAGFTLPGIAARLSERVGRVIAADTYRKWETESLLPHDVIVAFCDITHIHPFALLNHDPFAAPLPRREPARRRLSA
jgi:hypothetical protein